MWKHPKELNKIEDFSRPIIYWTWSGKCGIFNNNIVFFGGNTDNTGTLEDHISSWFDKCKKYNIKWWQFQDEISPCGIIGYNDKEWFGCEEEEITHEIWDAIGDNDKELQYKLIKNI